MPGPIFRFDKSMVSRASLSFSCFAVILIRFVPFPMALVLFIFIRLPVLKDTNFPDTPFWFTSFTLSRKGKKERRLFLQLLPLLLLLLLLVKVEEDVVKVA